MPAKDFVGRKPKNNKPRGKGRGTQSGGAKSASAVRRPYLAGLILLLLIGGFSYFLYTISGIGDHSSPTTSQTVQTATPPKASRAVTNNASATPASPSKASLPSKPEEPWRYIDELENKEVIVDVPAQKAPSRPYQMQCGSFRKASQADTMRATIAFQGLESQIRKTQGSNGVWYRVVLGPYERKRLAEKDRNKLRRADITTCQIWHWQG